jgi:hypothetical protein
MLVACRLVGLSALEAHYPARSALASSSASAAMRDPNELAAKSSVQGSRPEKPGVPA